VTREEAIQVVTRYAVFHPEPGEKYRVVRVDGDWQAQWQPPRQKFWARLDPDMARIQCGGLLRDN
jgi:hypothetical protein